jgi:hypothetical protein
MITADPFGRALNASLSKIYQLLPNMLGVQLTGFGIALVFLWVALEGQVETLVDLTNVLLEVGFDLGELASVCTCHEDPKPLTCCGGRVWTQLTR